MRIIDEVFQVCDSRWRGLGIIPESGFEFKGKYRRFDARSAFDMEISPGIEPDGCLCGGILRGVKIPPNCALFGKVCTPETPVGPCMVSSEGTCAAYYKYGNGTIEN